MNAHEVQAGRGQGMSNRLKAINHIVVLMLENRSFDNVAGWLYDPQNKPPFHTVPRNQPFEGVSGKNLSNPIPQGVEGAERKTVPVGKASEFVSPDADPGEEYSHVMTQLYGIDSPHSNSLSPFLNHPMKSLPEKAPMDGFVKDYIQVLREENRDVQYRDYKQIMDGFTPDMLPILSTLAHEYAICDQWFCSVPSQTWANRSFLHAGTSNGLVNNEPYINWMLYNGTDTVFNRISEAKRPDLTWKVYYDTTDILPLTLLIHFSRLQHYWNSHFFSMKQFIKDARKGNLPSYSFIEPRYLIDANDQHPPHNMLKGEKLIHDIYHALREGKNWDSTLFIITYDEHGGCYDHVSPPAAVPPDSRSKAGHYGFTFDRLGVRVCTLLISPYIEKGTVFRAKKRVGRQEVDVPLDHTAILKTITNRWGLASLTRRDKASLILARFLPGTNRAPIFPALFHSHIKRNNTPPHVSTPGTRSDVLDC